MDNVHVTCPSARFRTDLVSHSGTSETDTSCVTSAARPGQISGVGTECSWKGISIDGLRRRNNHPPTETRSAALRLRTLMNSATGSRFDRDMCCTQIAGLQGPER